MCRSGAWPSRRLCVLVPLFRSEQRPVSLVPLPEVSLPAPPPRNPHATVGLPAQQAAPPAPVSTPPFQTVEPKLAQLSMSGEALGSKCEAGVGGERILAEVSGVAVSGSRGK